MELAGMLLYFIALLGVTLLRALGAVVSRGASAELPGREADDRLYTGAHYLNPIGLSRGGRPMVWSRTAATTRVAVQHDAPDLRAFCLRVHDPRRHEPSVGVAPGLSAYGPSVAARGGPVTRLQAVRQELGRLLRAGRPGRVVEVSSAGVTLVAEESLSVAQCAALGQELDAIADALAREPGAAEPSPGPHAVARSEGPTRCAYCHDDLGGASTRCPGCATALHPECAAELRRCPTAGCAERRAAA